MSIDILDISTVSNKALSFLQKWFTVWFFHVKTVYTYIHYTSRGTTFVQTVSTSFDCFALNQLRHYRRQTLPCTNTILVWDTSNMYCMHSYFVSVSNRRSSLTVKKINLLIANQTLKSCLYSIDQVLNWVLWDLCWND